MNSSWWLTAAVLAAGDDEISVGNEAAKALISGTLGFIIALALDAQRRKREPRKELSWEATEHSTMPAAESGRSNDVVVLWRGEPVSGLWEVRCQVKNTGNSLIKNEWLRFKFLSPSRVLDAVSDPTPDPELEISQGTRNGTSPDDPQFLLGHLEPGDEAGFRFTVASDIAPSWEPVDYNADGGVNFVRRGAERRRKDAEHIPSFFALWVFLTFLPGALNLFFGLTDILQAFVRLILFGLLLRHVPPVARVVKDVVVRLSATGPAGVTIQGDLKAQTLAIGTGDIAMSVDGPEPSSRGQEATPSQGLDGGEDVIDLAKPGAVPDQRDAPRNR